MLLVEKESKHFEEGQGVYRMDCVEEVLGEELDFVWVVAFGELVAVRQTSHALGDTPLEAHFLRTALLVGRRRLRPQNLLACPLTAAQEDRVTGYAVWVVNLHLFDLVPFLHGTLHAPV